MNNTPETKYIWKISCMLQQQIVREHDLPAHCTGKLFTNKTFLQAAREHCLQTLPCCKVHSTVAVTQKPRATVRLGYTSTIR